MTVAHPSPGTSPELAARAPFEPFRQRAQHEFFGSLADHLDRLTWDGARLRSFQTERLRTLLAHAVAHSPFHTERLVGVDVDRFELTDLRHLPVMGKPAMMERFDDVVTDRRLRRSDVERLIEVTGDEPIPAHGDYLLLTSGGSGGTRGIFVLDTHAFAEFAATVVRTTVARRAAQSGAPIQEPTTAMIAAGSPIHATGATPLLLQGAPGAIAPIPVTLPFDEIVDRVRSVEPDFLLGYPSVIVRLAREQLDGRLDLHPLGVTTTSENLRPEVRAEIEQAFGVGVVDTFGSTEGLVGASAPGEATLTFASDSCIVELVDELDRPVAAGEPSASVLVTNLFNLTQPLIRYRMDDRFIQQPPSGEHGHLRAIVDGRTSDTLRWGDVVVHPLTVTNELIHTPAVADYIVRQTKSGVEIDVVATAEIELDVLSERITLDLTRAGLRGADVVVRAIDDIGRNPHTGKVARIVPLDHAS